MQVIASFRWKDSDRKSQIVCNKEQSSYSEYQIEQNLKWKLSLFIWHSKNSIPNGAIFIREVSYLMFSLESDEMTALLPNDRLTLSF